MIKKIEKMWLFFKVKLVIYLYLVTVDDLGQLLGEEFFTNGNVLNPKSNPKMIKKIDNLLELQEKISNIGIVPYSVENIVNIGFFEEKIHLKVGPTLVRTNRIFENRQKLLSIV